MNARQQSWCELQPACCKCFMKCCPQLNARCLFFENPLPHCYWHHHMIPVILFSAIWVRLPVIKDESKEDWLNLITGLFCVILPFSQLIPLQLIKWPSIPSYLTIAENNSHFPIFHPNISPTCLKNFPTLCHRQMERASHASSSAPKCPLFVFVGLYVCVCVCVWYKTLVHWCCKVIGSTVSSGSEQALMRRMMTITRQPAQGTCFLPNSCFSQTVKEK